VERRNTVLLIVQLVCSLFRMVYSLNGSVHAVNHATSQVITPFYGLWWSVQRIIAQPDSSAPHSTFMEGACNSPKGDTCPEPTHTADMLSELRDKADTLFKHPQTVNQHRPISTRHHKVNANHLSTSWRYIGGSRGIAPLLLYLGTRWRLVVNLRPLPL